MLKYFETTFRKKQKQKDSFQLPQLHGFICAYHHAARGSNLKHTIYAFFDLYYSNCNEKRTKIKEKRGRDWPIFKKKDSFQFAFLCGRERIRFIAFRNCESLHTSVATYQFSQSAFFLIHNVINEKVLLLISLLFCLHSMAAV